MGAERRSSKLGMHSKARRMRKLELMLATPMVGSSCALYT
jgi:hypothetical protein